MPIQQMFLGAGGPVALAEGQHVYNSSGTYSWTVPANVEAVSVVCVGSGGGGAVTGSRYGGGGGACAYKNNISVTAGSSISVVVGVEGYGDHMGSDSRDGGDSYFSSTSVCKAEGGHSPDTSNNNGGSTSNCVGDGSYSGGNGGTGSGGGGGQGSSSNGGNGSGNYATAAGGSAGNGGGGGGADAHPSTASSRPAGSNSNAGAWIGAGGGGGDGNTYSGGGGGGGHIAGSTYMSGGGSGTNMNFFGNWWVFPGDGGQPGGGGGGWGSAYDPDAISAPYRGKGRNGAVRIIYPAVYEDGSVRSFPSTNVGDV
jgi:hypothetical protein